MAIGSIYRPFLEVLRESGVDVDAALGRLGLTQAQLVEGGTRLTPEQGRAVGAMFAADGDPVPLGLRAAARFAAADADLLGYVMCSSPHALAALEALARHGRLIGDAADFRLQRSGNRMIATVALIGGQQMLPAGADFAAGAVYRLLRDASAGRVLPLAIALPRQRPRSAAAYTRFFGLPVQFGAPAVELVYDERSLLHPLARSDRRLARILHRHADAVTATLPPWVDDWHARVRALLAQRIAAHGRGSARSLELAAVARRCGVSERTLRRRLAQSGTSYRALVDDVRKERALALLAERTPVAAVARQLGFAEPTAFTRAFRRWTGSLPHAHERARRGRASRAL